MSNWNFQHFDTKSDFGVVDENGITHRMRKKPGRKANPAASAQRKVSNAKHSITLLPLVLLQHKLTAVGTLLLLI